MNDIPRLTIGLPVYNGENFVAEAIESLLGQTFEDFELIITDNSSTDGTADICRQYEKLDPRIRYVRQQRNIGIGPNHNFIVAEARGEFVKWASHDDLYARDMIERCVQALDEYPDVVLAHPWTAMIDGSGEVIAAIEYPLNTSSPSAPERFRSTLFTNGGDDTGGVVRAKVMRRTTLLNSFHHADRTSRPNWPCRAVSTRSRLAVLPAGTPRAVRADQHDGPRPVRQPGSAPVRSAPSSGGPPVRRVRLGLRGRGSERPPDLGRTPDLLRLPSRLSDQPGPAGARTAHGHLVGPAGAA